MNAKMENIFVKNFQHEITASTALSDELLIALKSGELVFLSLIDYTEIKRINFEGLGPVYKMGFRNNLIYFAGADAKFYCMKKDGAIVWIHEFQNAISEFFFSDLGIKDREFILICAYDKTFRVLDAHTGAYHWAQMAGLGIEYAAVGYDTEQKIDAVFICSDDGTVRKLNPKNGEMTAYFESPKVIRAVVADFQNQLVYAGGDEMVLYVLDYQKLTVRNTVKFDTYIWDLFKFHNNLVVQLYNFSFLEELLETTGDPGLVFYTFKDQSLTELNRIMKLNIQCKSIKRNFMFAGTTDGQLAVVDLQFKSIIALEKIGTFINSIFIIEHEKNKWTIGTCEENGDLKVFGCAIFGE